MESEAHDRQSIDLPPGQKALVKAIAQLQKPTVSFLLNGGMVAVETIIEETAVIEAFYPGAEGAKALAQAIFGQSNRWGRLPYTIYPANWTESHSITDEEVSRNRTYRYNAPHVLPFGWGLSYTTFEMTHGGSSSSLTLSTDNSDVAVLSIDILNSGDREGDIVLQAYLEPMDVPLNVFPNRTMFDFQRENDLLPGQRLAHAFEFNAHSLLLATEDGDLASVPGHYNVVVEDGFGGHVSVPLTISGSLTVVEPFPTPKSA